MLVSLAACGTNGMPASVNYGTLNFTVVDAATGSPLAGATVLVNTVLGTGQVTSSTGSVSIYPIPPGQYDYNVFYPAGTKCLNDPNTWGGSIQPGATASVTVQCQHA